MWAFGTIDAKAQASKWPVVNPGSHMTVLSRDLMYNLWYVFAICVFSPLEFDFLYFYCLMLFAKMLQTEKNLILQWDRWKRGGMNDSSDEVMMCLCVFFFLRYKTRKSSHQLWWRPQVMWLWWAHPSNTHTVRAVRKVAKHSELWYKRSIFNWDYIWLKPVLQRGSRQASSGYLKLCVQPSLLVLRLLPRILPSSHLMKRVEKREANHALIQSGSATVKRGETETWHSQHHVSNL